jgi:predicted flap endonuclease-1-like 5' DNA nuclease
MDLQPPEGLLVAVAALDGVNWLVTLLGLVAGTALGSWIGWTLHGLRARARRRDEEAWESEIVRAAGLARGRAADEKQQLEDRLARLQNEHGKCSDTTQALAGRIREKDELIEKLEQDLADAAREQEQRTGKARELDRRVAELEASIEQRDQRDGAPNWLMSGADGDKDDLTAIRGLGPTIERRLNRLGIYHYRQLAQMTADNAHWIAVKIHVVPGRILRDRWAEQAQLMLEGNLGDAN